MTDLRTVAQQTLEAWDNDENGTLDHPLSSSMETLRAALEQPEQEPVGEVVCIDGDCENGPEAIVQLHNPVELGQHLFIHQPRREWQGLTDAELREAYLSVSGNEWCLGGMANAESFYEAVEAKLKKKNA